MKVMWMRVLKKIRWSIKKTSKEKKRLLLNGVMALVIGAMAGGYIGKNAAMKDVEKRIAVATEQVKKEEQKQKEETKPESDTPKEEPDESKVVLPWNLVLVNEDHPMEEGYVPELVQLQGDSYVDERIVDSARQMMEDAKEAGMKLVLCSAYRSVKRQENVFNESMQDRLGQGMTYWEAYVDTSKSVANPGKSEHALGLALDLISNQYVELDKRQETTKEAKWLKENCHKYGFILRYPPAKMDITGIIYEPWHYRYVGVEVATEIMESGLTLEEYLQEKYGFK